MILGILQARYSSTRLPGKVLKPILNKPMLALQLERLRQVGVIDTLVVATSTDPSDDAIEALCQTEGVACFRGSLNDVLDRFYQAALQYKPDHVVRLTGDCPLSDPDVIEEIIQIHFNEGYDYTSNVLQCTYPDGLDVEIFRNACLEAAWKEAKLPSEREHVTPFINQHPERFLIHHHIQAIDFSSHRWTVDEPEDFELVKRIYEALYPTNPQFRMMDVLRLLHEKPEWSLLNQHFVRNEGLIKSRQSDA